MGILLELYWFLPAAKRNVFSLLSTVGAIFFSSQRNFGVSSVNRAEKFDNLRKKGKTLISSYNGREIKVQTAGQQTLSFSLNTSRCK